MIAFFLAKGRFLTFPMDIKLVGDEDNSEYPVFSQKANQPDCRWTLGGRTPISGIYEVKAPSGSRSPGAT